MDASNNIWIGSGNITRTVSGTPKVCYSAGKKALAGVLALVSVIPSDSDNFDAGNISIMVE